MVIEKNKEIRYYKNSGDKEAKGSMSLLNASVYSHVEKKGKEMSNYFNIRVGQRDFLMRASTAAEKTEWVKMIKANIVIDEAKKKVTSPKLAKGSSSTLLGVVKQTD